ncbi:MAG: hypothetical protein IPK74_28980 [Deltaproteobacteria bacterium]|nr:hypothetical protein [Deltaproteobacteria bacterium]
MSTPALVGLMALPTYLTGRATSARGARIAVPWMAAAAFAAYLVLGATWAVWGFAAQQLCRLQ